MSAANTTKECARLTAFKQFLREENEKSNNATNNTDLRNCMARRNNETYPVNETELNAEIIMSIWTQLQIKNCPTYFQLSILQAVLHEVQQQCRSAKECDLNYTTRQSMVMDKLQEQAALEENYDLVKLQKFVLNTLECLLIRLNDNMEEGNLKNYAKNGTLCSGEQCQCVLHESTNIHVASAIKNKPRKMEDRHICLERFGEMYQLSQNSSFYGVFDGHSGPFAAIYAMNQLPKLLADALKMHKNKSALTVEDYRECFETAFLQVDQHFVSKCISSGTTAVCALITASTYATAGHHLFVAWVGDSKALLVGPKASLQLVKSHKPDSQEERQRIESIAAGGTVMFVQGHWRVNGILNVSRSIGDYTVQAAIAEPDFVDVELSAAHDFLVLGTDGLFDHVPEADIVCSVYEALLCNEQKLEDIPKLLIDLAKQNDSQDNITVVLVLLKTRTEIIANYKTNENL